MSNRLTIGFALALLAVAGAVALLQVGGDGRDREGVNASGLGRGKAAASFAEAGKSGRGGHSPTKRIDPAETLRALLDDEPPAFSFREIEAFARRVSREELEELRSLSGSVRPDGVGGWVRAAVFAALAKRDPESAFDFIVHDESMLGMDSWGIRQAWFATFRGWAEADAPAAAAKLLDYLGPKNQTGKVEVLRPARGFSREAYEALIGRDEIWKRQAFEEVFTRYAMADPGAAWEALPAKEMAGLRESAMEGLFRGVRDEESWRILMERWDAELNAAAQVNSLAERSLGEAEDEVRLVDPLARADRRSIAIEAALSLARVHSDPEAGADWMRTALKYDPVMRMNSERLYYEALSRERPDQLEARIAEGSELPPFLLSSLVGAQPDRVGEFFARVEDREIRTGALQMAIAGQSRLHLDDLFAAPGRSNRWANYADRYRALLSAVEAAGAGEDRERNLLNQLNQEFAPVVPEARAALELRAGGG